MCGLAGILGSPGGNHYGAAMDAITSIMSHRGPDDHGVFQSPGGAPLSLGHRRLAIIDPLNGKQPMTTADERYTVIFNGAIYNYLELRQDLIGRGQTFTTYSDTEVILGAYRQWGTDCVEHFNGMFSFAVWDEKERKLFCARDRIGIKPFYYAFDGRSFVFASEIKAVLAARRGPAEADQAGLQDYLTFQFCLGDKTMFRDIKKLEPGWRLTASLAGDGRIELDVSQYWDVSFEVEEGRSEEYFIDYLKGLIEDAVRLQLRADVPLGAHLSGGLDSSAVVSLASHHLGDIQVRTFTGAYDRGPDYDETPYAKAVAEHWDCLYNEVYIPTGDLANVFPKLAYHMDEPLAGPGLIPQYYVSKLAADKVKVVLGGQGGDELFLGYARYLVAYLEKCLSGAIYETADDAKYAVTLESIVPNLPVLQQYVPMMRYFWREGLFEDDDTRYFRLIDRSEGGKELIDGAVFDTPYSSFESFQDVFNAGGLRSLVNRMSYFDLKGSLPALLHVEDRTSMAVSLESRVPLLDHRIVEFMGRVPPNIKFADGKLKHLFREAVKHRVPSAVMDRKDKKGFPVPTDDMYHGKAKDFVHDLLFSKRTRERGLFDTDALRTAFEREGRYSRVTWGLLNLEIWHRIFIDGEWLEHARGSGVNVA